MYEWFKFFHLGAGIVWLGGMALVILALRPMVVAQMAPPERLGEFFGLWTFAIRLASIVGPLSYGLITWLSGGNQRLAIGSTSLLFVLGLVLLMPVNVARGRRMALGQD